MKGYDQNYGYGGYVQSQGYGADGFQHDPMEARMPQASKPLGVGVALETFHGLQIVAFVAFGS